MLEFTEVLRQVIESLLRTTELSHQVIEAEWNQLKFEQIPEWVDCIIIYGC